MQCYGDIINKISIILGPTHRTKFTEPSYIENLQQLFMTTNVRVWHDTCDIHGTSKTMNFIGVVYLWKVQLKPHMVQDWKIRLGGGEGVTIDHMVLFCCTVPATQCSRLKSSMLFKCDLALQNIPLSKQPYKTQPEIENEDVT